MSSVLKLDAAKFEEVLKGDLPVVVDFYADWCGPCQALAPLLEEVATAFSGQIVVGKVNVDQDPDLAAPYQVRSIPTLVAFRKGQKTATQVGGMTKSALTSWIQGIIAG